MNDISYDDSSFPDVIDADSCWRSYWQQVVTHGKTDLDIEVIENPDDKYYLKKLCELLFEVPIWSMLLKTFEDAEEQKQLYFYKKAETKFTNCHAELFFRTKKLDKLNFELLLPNTLK